MLEFIKECCKNGQYRKAGKAFGKGIDLINLKSQLYGDETSHLDWMIDNYEIFLESVSVIKWPEFYVGFLEALADTDFSSLSKPTDDMVYLIELVNAMNTYNPWKNSSL